MEEMNCSVCGEKFNAEYVDFLDNGNPACPKCIEEEELKNNEE